MACPEEDKMTLRRRLSARTTVGEAGGGEKGEVGEVFEALMGRGMDVKEAVEVLVKTIFL